MAAAPKGVAGRRNSLPAQQAAADPLQTYCPDLDQWPRSWAYEGVRYSARSAAGGMLQAVPAQPAGPAAVAPNLAPTPRQHLGSWRRAHPRIADGQRPS